MFDHARLCQRLQQQRRLLTLLIVRQHHADRSLYTLPWPIEVFSTNYGTYCGTRSRDDLVYSLIRRVKMTMDTIRSLEILYECAGGLRR